MEQNDVYQINKRIDDMRDEIKSDLYDIKEYMKSQNTFCVDRKTVFDKRVSDLEHFKTKILTIGTGLGIIFGIFVGKGL